MIDHGMDPQSALDAARFCVGTRNMGMMESVYLEEGMPQDTFQYLRDLGHTIAGPVKDVERTLFGRGQIICSRPVGGGGRERENVWWAGSDGRGDGVAIGY